MLPKKNRSIERKMFQGFFKKQKRKKNKIDRAGERGGGEEGYFLNFSIPLPLTPQTLNNCLAIKDAIEKKHVKL